MEKIFPSLGFTFILTLLKVEDSPSKFEHTRPSEYEIVNLRKKVLIYELHSYEMKVVDLKKKMAP